MARRVDASLVEEFQRNGVVCVREAFSEKWVESVRRGVDRVRNNPSSWSESLRGDMGDGFYFNDYCQWQKIEEFEDYVLHSPAAAMVGQLLQSEYVCFYHEHTLVKDAGTSKKTPWHVDQTYYPIDGDKACSIWMPLDPVSEETTLEFVVGSHLYGAKYRPRKFATISNYPLLDGGTDTEYVDVPDVERNREEYNILKWSVQPGDAVIFHMKTLHGAPENMTDTPRRVFSTRWLGDDCTLASRPWETSPPYLGSLSVGDFVSDEFPKIWTRGASD